MIESEKQVEPEKQIKEEVPPTTKAPKPEEKAPKPQDIELLKVNSIQEVQFSKSDDVVLYLKERSKDLKTQELIVQHLNTKEIQEITIKYQEALQGQYKQVFEFINKTTMFCMHFDKTEGAVSLLRMKIEETDGKYVMEYDMHTTGHELGWHGTMRLMQMGS